jgi:polysaccharide pyruvyl transferase WcaK-like protein
LKEIVREIYPQLCSIAFRETISKTEYHSKITEGKNTIQAADTAWLLDECLTKAKLNNLSCQGGISIWHPVKTQPSFDFTSKYMCISGGSGFGHEKEDSEKISEIIQSLLERNIDPNILLVAPAQHDENILLRVAEKLNLPLAKVNNNSLVGASIIGNSELYLGGRWHGSIFAILNGTRLINFEANTFKIEALKKMIGSDHPIYPTHNLGSKSDQIANSVVDEINKGGIENSKEIHRKMKNYAKENTMNIGGTE